MSLWGLLAQGIQDTINHIGGFVTGTHPWTTNKKQMEQAEELQKHGMSLDEKNYQHTIDKFNYDKQIQQDIFKREDNSVQRRVADLRAAGINPILAAGQAAGSGAHVGTTAPMHSATGAVEGMSAKQKAYSIRHELWNQQRARSVQISQMIAHAQLLHEQAKTERAKQKELYTLAEEQSERTKGYSYTRTLQSWEIHEIASKIKVNERMLQKINAETEKINLDTEERRYNYNKAHSLGIRSDVNPTLIGELTQAIYALMHAREKFSFEKLKDQLSLKFPNLSDLIEKLKPENAGAAIQGFLQGISDRAREDLQIPGTNRSPEDTLRNRREGPLFR